MTNYESAIHLPEICAPRKELVLTYYQRAAKQYIYVQAPAGYGKTVSTLLWLKQSKCAFAWLTLDKYDNKPPLFYRSLCRALLTLVPKNETVSQLLVNPAFAESPVENTIEILSLLSWPEDKRIFVLDDLHSITDSEILKSLPFVLKRLPLSVNVLLLSRAALPDEMAGLTENGKTAHIGKDELAFTPDEIQKHYANYGQTITPKEAQEVHSYTDGWAIILNTMAKSGDIKPLNDKPALNEFFEKNIWNNVDKTMRIFLMKTSAADSLTPELCDRLTEGKYSAEKLETLMRENIPLSRLGDEYRYHNLFSDFLRSRLSESDIDQSALYIIAATYYLETGEFYKAALYSMRVENAPLRMRVIQNFFQSKNPPLEQFLEISTLYDNIPYEICDRAPTLYMPKILSAFLKGDIASATQLFDRLYLVFPALLQSNHPIVNAAITRLVTDFRVKLKDLPAFLDSLHIEKDIKVIGQAAIMTMQMPFLHRSVHDFYEFLDAGIMDSVRDFFSCVLPNDCELFFKSIRSGLYAEQNKLDKALDIALAAYNAITEAVSNEIAFGVSVGLAEIYLLKGQTENCRVVLSTLHDFIKNRKAQYLLKNLSAYETLTKLHGGDRKTAEDWLKSYFVNDSSFNHFYKIYQNFTTARAYIILSMQDEATAALKALKNLGIAMNRPLDAAEADVLTAIMKWYQGEKKEACDILCGALTALQPYGFIRIVANEGKAVLPILSSVIKKIELQADRDDELYRFAKEIYVAAYEQSKRFKGLTGGFKVKAVKLSPKQTLVLELLSKGNSKADIVEITGLSLNTISTHTKAAYEKLDVTNALDAIVEAKRLGILK